MSKATHVSIRIPDNTLLRVDELAFTRRKMKGHGRSATRTAVINDILATAVLTPVSNSQKD